MAVDRIKRIKNLLENAEKAAKIIRKHVDEGSFIRITSHLDADGLAAAGILGQMLARVDACFRIRVEKQIDVSVVEEVASEEAPLTIFTDFGSGYLNLLEEKLAKSEVVVIDHHPPNGSFPRLIHVNPHLEYLDGNRGISGAGLAYLTAKAYDKTNSNLASIAVVGALGDLQDKGKKRRLFGLNARIVGDAIREEYLKMETDLVFYGRETKPVHKALASVTTPFIPGLSGEEDKCLGFLVNLGIELKHQDRWRALADLATEEKQKIFSEMAKFLSSKGIPSETILNLIGTVYTLTHEERWTPLRDAREYASLLNACGRMDRSGLAVAVCMGSRCEALEEAQKVLYDYRRKLAEYMAWLTNTPQALEELGSIYVVKGEGVIDDKIVGVVASILTTSGLIDLNKPVIAFASSGNSMIKVSGRATELLTSRGLNLGEILRESSERFHGNGGGHDVAAGAQLPQEYEGEFTKLVDRLVYSSLNS